MRVSLNVAGRDGLTFGAGGGFGLVVYAESRFIYFRVSGTAHGGKQVNRFFRAFRTGCPVLARAIRPIDNGSHNGHTDMFFHPLNCR